MTLNSQVSDKNSIFTLRPFTPEDYPAVAALYIQHDLEFTGETNFSVEMLRTNWTSQPNFDPTEAVMVAVAEDEVVVGAATLNINQPVPVRPNCFIVARPDDSDRAISALLDWAINKSETVYPRVPDHARVVFQAEIHSKNTRMADCFKARGLTSERAFYNMLLRFEGQKPPEPVMPEGIKIVTFAEHPVLEDFARAVRDGFADHRGASVDTPWSFHLERMKNMTEDEHFDPTLFWLALDAKTGALAGVCNSYPISDEFADCTYIQQLAVMPDYRRQGLALALLHLAFNEHFKRGFGGVTLGVDAASLTNAVALYLRAGMSVAVQYDAYELELRAGEELTKQ